MEYLRGYGGRFGSRGNSPDLERCAAEVKAGDWHWKQCSRKANSDPDDKGRPTTCGVHSEVRKAARLLERKKWEADGIGSVLNADICAVNRVIALIERRNLVHTQAWEAARSVLNAVLKELADA